MLTCWVVRGHLLVQETIHPSHGSDEEVLCSFSLFTSCPQTGGGECVMLCRLASSACDQHVTVFFKSNI